MDIAGESFSDVIVQEKVPVALGRVQHVQENRATPDLSTGTAEIEVIRDLRQRRNVEPVKVKVSFARAGTIFERRHEPIGWNAVDLTAGILVVIALPDFSWGAEASERSPIASPAVRQVASPEDSFVVGVEAASQIQQVHDLSKKKILLRDALPSSNEFLSGFAHYAVGRLHQIPRADAVACEVSVMSNDGLPPRARIQALLTSELELWQLGSSDEPNRDMFQAFVGLLAAKDVEIRRKAVETLYRVLQAPDGDVGRRRYESLLMNRSRPSPPQLRGLSDLEPDPAVGEYARWLVSVLAHDQS